MKALAFVDLHEDKKALQKLLERAKQKDIEFLISAGDLSQFGRNLRYVLKQLNDLGKKIYLIPGNHESEDVIAGMVKDYPNCLNLHKLAINVGEYVFLGYGGGGFSHEDSEFRKISRQWYGEHQGKKIVLVTHGPPHGTKVDSLGGSYVGNKDFRSFIERIKPKLVLCGHIHENAGVQDKIGESQILNPGWDGRVIELS